MLSFFFLSYYYVSLQFDSGDEICDTVTLHFIETIVIGTNKMKKDRDVTLEQSSPCNGTIDYTTGPFTSRIKGTISIERHKEIVLNSTNFCKSQIYSQ